jgi:hypothetical protein
MKQHKFSFLTAVFVISSVIVSCSTLPYSTEDITNVSAAFLDTAIHSATNYTPQDHQIPQDFIGISPGELFRTDQQSNYDMLDNLGVVWMRRAIDWVAVEPNPGQWEWGKFDAYVNNGKAAGKKLLLILAYDNPYFYEDRQDHRNITADHLPAFINYVETVVKRYKGKVDAWEIWNEPNLPIFWSGTQTDYFNMVKASVKKIREIDPNAKILTGSFWRTPESFVTDMFAAGAFEGVDAISFHPYQEKPLVMTETNELFDVLATIAAKNNFKGEIWATEVGYPTAGIYPVQAPETEGLPNNYSVSIIKSIAGLATRDVSKVIWYELLDQYNQGQVPEERKKDSEVYFGIIYPDFTLKKGAYAFKLCSQYLPGTTYLVNKPTKKDIPSSITSYFFKGEGKNVLIVWNEDVNPLNKVNLKISIPNATPVSHDIYSDRESSLPQTTIAVSQIPLFITWDGDSEATLSK